MRLLVALVILFGLTACGGTEVGRPDAGGSLAQPSTGAQPVEVTKSARGLLPKKVGEVASITDAEPDDKTVVRFVIEAITVDPKCTAEYAQGPEHGHFIAVKMNIETAPEFDPSRVFFSATPGDFSIEGPDGFTDAALLTGSSFGCLTQQEQLPAQFGPAGKYAGTVMLDSRYAAGVLMFKPPVLTDLGAGWEWPFPA